MYFKIGVLKKFRKFHRKTPTLGSLFTKVAGVKICNSGMCFPVKFAKFVRTHFFYRTPPVAASVLLKSKAAIQSYSQNKAVLKNFTKF